MLLSDGTLLAVSLPLERILAYDEFSDQEALSVTFRLLAPAE